MESFFSGFIRVLRNLDDVDGLIKIFQEFEQNPSALSAEDRTRLLDFPDLATQEANIKTTAPTVLNKEDLLRKAVESPISLTQSEIDLLRTRYWRNFNFGERTAFEDTIEKLYENADPPGTDPIQRLRDFQSHLYQQDEAQAIANASDEDDRRLREMREMLEVKKQNELETMLQYGQPWLQQLWQEDEGKKPWGYAMFENPEWQAEDPDRWDAYDRQSSKAMHFAFSAMASTITIRSKYTIEELDWPSEAPNDDKSFSVIVRELRKRFNYLRSFAPKKERRDILSDLSAGVIESEPEGLTVGTLRNVFLYLDGSAAASVLDNRLADDFWIWAIDPDFVEVEDTENQNQTHSGYKGYLRVRLQQLINNFYVARRWHAGEFSLEDLWKAAQKDPHSRSFVSMKDEEIVAWNDSWEVSIAIRSKAARERDKLARMQSRQEQLPDV